MARNTMEAWIPEEDGSEVIQRVQQSSGIERFARRVPMSTDTRNHPRSAGVDVEYVPKGAAYGEDDSANDAVILIARKFGKLLRIAEEDVDDASVDVIEQKQSDWATSYAKHLDNAALAVTAAQGAGVPFTSVYHALTQENTDTGYTANDNLVQTGSGGPTYDHLSQVVGLAEAGDYFDETNLRIIAHPSFRGTFRGVKDEQGQPIFLQGLAGTPDTLFGIEVAWSSGARTSATATPTPDGNPLLVVFNRDYAILGVRSGPESMVSEEASFETDEHLLKVRARRGFAVGHEKAFAVLEDNS